MTAPLSASFALSPACPSRWRVTHAVHDLEHGRHQLWLRGQQQAQRDGQRQHPLAHRHDTRTWQHDVQSSLRWSGDGGSILFTSPQQGRCHAWRHELASGQFRIAARGGWVQGFDLAASSGGEMPVVLTESVMHPGQVHAVGAGRSRRLESFNDRQGHRP